MNEYTSNIAWTPERSEKLLRGTVTTGVGLSMIAILLDQMRSAKRRENALKGKVLDDGQGTITISPPGKTATFTEWVLGGAAGVGTYALIQKLYGEIRRKQLQKEIEEADKAYTNTLQESVNQPFKKAGHEKEALSPWEILLNLPKDTFFLPALLSAGATYGLLENTYPKVKEKPDKVKPRQIVVKGFGTVHADGPGDGPLGQADKEMAKQWAENYQAEREPALEQPMAKAANLVAPITDKDYKCAAAMLVYLLGEQPSVKSAATGLFGLIGEYHRDSEKVASCVGDVDAFGVLDLTKGGDFFYHSLPTFEKRAAVQKAFDNPKLSPMLTVLALGELEELSPDLGKRAKALNTDTTLSAMGTKLAALIWQAEASEAGVSKESAVSGFQEDMRRQLGTLGLEESKDAEGVVDESDAAYSAKGDPIDQFMAGKSS